ncbi:hypothetical protein [Streptomyces sp. NPDC059013]|uniref:hypothetical protein n=1 Tax=unclassified Streptomyces TaxID=2593676 RepID=UPI0036C620B9
MTRGEGGIGLGDGAVLGEHRGQVRRPLLREGDGVGAERDRGLLQPVVPEFGQDVLLK